MINGEESEDRATRHARIISEIENVVRHQQVDRAAEMAEQALEVGVEHPMLLNLSAYRLEGQGKLDQALSRLRRARELAPRDPPVLNALGQCLSRLERFDEALEVFDAALAVEPNLAPVLFVRGSVLDTLGDLAGARDSYERAAALNAKHPGPWAGLASLASRAGDFPEARRHAASALALAPGHPGASIALAMAELGVKDHAAAEKRLRAVLANPAIALMERVIAQGLLADALDGQGRHSEAFVAYTLANDEERRLHALRFAGSDSPVKGVRVFVDYFTAARAEDWNPRGDPADAAAKGPAGGHVFLVGFPRSGTTLLENVLSANPAIVALEERDTLEAPVREFMHSARTLDRLAAAGDAELRPFRDAYWARIAAEGVDATGKVFVDKLPLNSVKLCVISRLFPQAKILFALRDPRDVVLSCFRRRFRMNPAMYQMLTLEGVADYYDAVMSLAEVYTAKLPLTGRNQRHEDLVNDFDGQARELCDFLGTPWSTEMAGFAARGGRAINTPSSAQVAQGLNREGLGQWRAYEREMAPVLPRLQRWLDKFGYQP